MKSLSGKRPKRNAAAEEPVTSLAKVLSKRDRKNSRTKGANGERNAAKRWSEWTGDHLRRTPQSGGWSNAKFGVTGDLVCDRPKFPFSLEIKVREGWDLEDLITGVRRDGTRSILEWWAQTRRACPANKMPVLVFKKNHGVPLVMFRQTDYEKMLKAHYKVGDFTVDFAYHLKFNHDDGDVVVIAEHVLFSKIRPPRGCKGRRAWVASPVPAPSVVPSTTET